MLEARKVLEDYETLKGFVSTCEHMGLSQEFTKATETSYGQNIRPDDLAPDHV